MADKEKKKNFFGRALDYLVNSYQSQVAAQNQANQMLADNFDNNPKEQKQLREEMLNHDYGAALSRNSEDTKKIRNTVGDVATDIVLDQSVGKVVDYGLDKGVRYLKNRFLDPEKAKFVLGEPRKIPTKNKKALDIIDNFDDTKPDLSLFDINNHGEGITYRKVDYFDNDYFFEPTKTIKELENDLILLPSNSEKARKINDEIQRIKNKELFDKTIVRYKLQKPDGTIINKQSPLSYFLPQKMEDLDGNISLLRAKIYDEGIPLNHDGSPLNINDAFRKAFQDEDIRRISISNTFSDDEKINAVKNFFGTDKIAKLYKEGYSEKEIKKMCVNYYNVNFLKENIDGLYETTYNILDGENFRPHFRDDFPYETIGLDKERSEILPRYYNDKLPQNEINKEYNDYFNSLDFSSIEREAEREGPFYHNYNAGSLSSPESVKEWMKNMAGQAEYTSNINDLYEIAKTLKDAAKSKGFKATVYTLVNHLSKSAYDRLRDIVPPYQETTAKDLVAWLYNKDWLTENELFDLIENMDRDTYFDLIAPIAAIVFSDKDELIKFLRYKPAFYHNAIKSNELYPGWKKQFENSVSGEKEKNLLKNYKDSKYTVDSNGNMKLLDWEMSDTEYQDFKKKQRTIQRALKDAPRG